MTVTITLGWWLIPFALFVAGLVAFYLGGKQHGWFGGFGEALIGFALWFAALVSLIAGWVASP